jgi:hypothetical protein
MPLNSLQICTLSAQNAMVPGYATSTSNIAILYLNLILQDLCQSYDFIQAQGTFQFNLPTATDSLGRATLNFPADYLRAKRDDCFYYIQGVPYKLIPLDLDEMDGMVVTAGLANFPQSFAVDCSQIPPLAYFWMPPSGAFTAIVRYQRLMPDLPIPADTTVPWFPNQNYLITRLTGELCKIADDERQVGLLSDDDGQYPGGAGVVLRKYLMLHNDTENRAMTVKLDRRRFGSSFDRLRNTKQVGW